MTITKSVIAAVATGIVIPFAASTAKADGSTLVVTNGAPTGTPFKGNWVASRDWSKGEEPSPVQVALRELAAG